LATGARLTVPEVARAVPMAKEPRTTLVKLLRSALQSNQNTAKQFELVGDSSTRVFPPTPGWCEAHPESLQHRHERLAAPGAPWRHL